MQLSLAHYLVENPSTDLKACPGINYLDKTCHTHSLLTVNISI